MYWISEAAFEHVFRKRKWANPRWFFDCDYLCFGSKGNLYAVGLFEPQEIDTSEQREAIINFAKVKYAHVLGT